MSVFWLKVLSWLPWMLIGGYLFVWVVLLVNCLRRREFVVLAGDEKKTRWFWLVTFLFFNPLLSVLYIAFVLVKPSRPLPARWKMVCVLGAVAIGFFVNIPGLTHLWMVPVMGEPGDEAPWMKLHASVIEARNNFSTSHSTSSTNNDRFVCRRVCIINESNHSLL